jgi:hypothetical protein
MVSLGVGCRLGRRSGHGLLIASVMMLVGWGCASPGEIRYATGDRAGESPDGLRLVETWGGRAQRVYARPGVDLKQYDRVLLEPVVIRFSLASADTLDTHAEKIVAKTFDETFEKELRRSSVHALVDEPGEGVLRVTPQLVDVVVAATPPSSSRDRVYVESAGAVTLALEVSDSRTHAVLVRAFDRRAIGSEGGTAFESSATRNLYEAELVFAQWARRLRQSLDRVKEIPPLPAETQ